MTITTSFFARFSRAFRKDASDQPDAFDLRLQKLSITAARQHKHSQSVFKSRSRRLAV